MPSTKKTIKFNPLDDIPRKTMKPVQATEEIRKSDSEIVRRERSGNSTYGAINQIVSYQLDRGDQKGSSELQFNGEHYGFELPKSGFIPIEGKDLKMQLKRPFPMPQAIGSFVTGGPIGFLFSFILGEPKPKKYFFSLTSNQGDVIFISLDRLVVDSIMQAQ